MREPGDEGSADLDDRTERYSSVRKEAWVRTVEDTKALAEERREQGWEVVVAPAGHTAPVSRDAGDDDDFGIVHVIADNHAEEFSGAYARGEFPRYEAYRNEVDGAAYLVTEFLDPDAGIAILLAGQYDLLDAGGMVTAARDEGVLYVRVQRLDGTVLGLFEIDEFDPLLPDPDRVAGTATGERSPDEG